MAQHDMYLENAKGAAFRADLNNALAALVSNNAGATEPNPAFANMLWYDTSTDQLKVRDNANVAWYVVHDATQETVSNNEITYTADSGTIITEKVMTDRNGAWVDLNRREYYGHDSNNNSTMYVRSRGTITHTDTDGQEQGGFIIDIATGGKEADTSATGISLKAINAAVDYPVLNLRNCHGPGQAGILNAMSFSGLDDASTSQTYGQVVVNVDSAVAGSEDSTVKLEGLAGGTLTTFLKYMGPNNVMRTLIPNYETKVTHDDDIPNKKYVDDRAPIPDCYFARSHGVITVNNTAAATLNFSINNGNVGGFGWSGGVLTIPETGLYEIYVSCYVGVWGGSIGDYLSLVTQINTGSGYANVDELAIFTPGGSFDFHISSRTFIKSLSANDTLRCRYSSNYGAGGAINSAQLMVKRIG